MLIVISRQLLFLQCSVTAVLSTWHLQYEVLHWPSNCFHFHVATLAASRLHTCTSVCKQCNLVRAARQWCCETGKVTSGVMERMPAAATICHRETTDHCQLLLSLSDDVTTWTCSTSSNIAVPISFIYYYASWQPDIYRTVIYTLHSYTKIKNISK